MFKIIMLQQWYRISDDMAEYVINDRLSFQRFLGLCLSSKVPDSKTIWAFKEQLEKSGADLRLFELFERQMEAQGIITREGSIIDASFVDVPRQRNSRKENAEIKEGEVPEEWVKRRKYKLSQKDTDAAWAKKNEELHYGYKNHIKADKDSKMIVSFTVTPANTHDSQVFEDLLDSKDKTVNADSAYTGEEIHESIEESYPNIELRVNDKGYKNNPLPYSV
jgi:IS5 family transposase